ncbi:MAG: CBS domain-containing protein [Bacteroidota bacterium]
MMNEEVRTIMSADYVTVSPTQTVNDVLRTMERKRLQQLPVVDDNNHQLVGLITSYDLWKSCRKDKSCGQELVQDVMTTDVVRLAPKDKVGTAAELFMDRRFKTLPVVNLRGELKGVVTAFDVIRYSFRKEYPEPILYADRF